MRNKLLYLFTIASIVLFGACSNEDVLPETNTESGRTLSLTASMPDDNPSTRVILNPQTDKSIEVRWAQNDEIQLAFVQGANKIKETVTVTSISNNGKTAHFDIPIPSEVVGQFKLYGVYGGGGIVIEDPNPVAIMPTVVGNGLSNNLMLHFEYDMNTEDSDASVVFKHLGSLFNISLINVEDIPAEIISQIVDLRLVEVGGDSKWAYNSVGSQKYDLETGIFLNQGSAGNYISLKSAGGNPSTLWAWYPLLPGKVWPELEIQLIGANETVLTTSINSKTRLKAPVAGMSYNFYAEWDGTQLNFVAPIGPGQINLGSAAKYTILTKTGITTTGITAIQGNIGVSPYASTDLTGFGTLVMNTGGKTSHTEDPTLVTGEVYAANYAAPTPSDLTVAVLDMENAYITANALLIPAPIINEGAGNISGLTLTPGLYKWGTGVEINSGASVTLSGGPDDTWVFQIAQDLTLNPSAQVKLIGGAQAKNIAWVVAGQTVLGTETVIYGNILSKTLISLNTGAKVTGLIYAQTAVTMIAATINKP